MVDKPADGEALRSAWRSLGQRTAVVGGAFVAFYALFHHVPASTAALRGAGTWLVLLYAARATGLLLQLAERFDRAARLKRETTEGVEEASPSREPASS